MAAINTEKQALCSLVGDNRNGTLGEKPVRIARSPRGANRSDQVDVVKKRKLDGTPYKATLVEQPAPPQFRNRREDGAATLYCYVLTDGPVVCCVAVHDTCAC
jgi:hypothetical protein